MSAPLAGALHAELRALAGEDAVVDPERAGTLYLDATIDRGLRGRADAVVLPRDAATLARVVGWCCEHDVAIVPRGGGTGFAGGAVTGRQVLALEAVLASGERVELGAAVTKDVAGYALKDLLVGSEGTLALVTRVLVRLLPPPEAALPVVGFYPDVASGCAALEAARTCGAFPALIEYLDGAALALSGVPGDARGAEGAGFAVLVEADGAAEQAHADRELLREALADGALATWAPAGTEGVRALWRWRDGVAHAVNTARGGKLSEDVVVPFARIREAIEATLELGARHDLPACSWGHAGDGNLHSTFLVDPGDPAQLARAEEACEELFDVALELGGSVSGEHGVGLVKRAAVARQLTGPLAALQGAIKHAFDPKGLLNPGKKLPPVPTREPAA